MRNLRAVGVVLLGCVACDFTLTRDPEPFTSLEPSARAAADRIFARLQAFDARLRAVSGGARTLGRIAADETSISIAPDGVWVMLNLGDDVVHLSVWERLASNQQTRFASWFGDTLAVAAQVYGTFFYDLIALHLAGIQAVYAIQGVAWVYGNRSAFNVDRDAERLVDNYLVETDPTLFAFAGANCRTIVSRFDTEYGAWFNVADYSAHVRELADLDDPTGQIYMICRHLQAADARRIAYTASFAAEVEVLEEYRQEAGDATP